MKINKSFFTGDEVLFIGYSAKNKSFSNMIMNAFTSNGINVYPMNNKPSSIYDTQVYHSLDQLPKVPEVAYVLLNKNNSNKIINQLADSGVKKIIFQNKKCLDNAVLEACRKRKLEAVVACPMMILGSGIHKLHGYIAGVR